jgi:hypothetical protein
MRFCVHRGPAIAGAEELLRFLPRMTDEQFAHHVRQGKNDFAQWLDDVHGADEATAHIRMAWSRQDLERVLRAILEDGRGPPKPHASPPAHGPTGSQASAPFVLAEKIQSPPSGPASGDASFGRLRDEYAHRNELMQERYDEIATRLREALDDPFPKELMRREERLRERYDELRSLISETRRSGKDVLIATLALRMVSPKLALAHATREPKDYECAEQLLAQARAELDEAARAPMSDVRAEVLSRAGVSERAKERI